MARRLRLESEGGVYHVLNRGNYRASIFEEHGTKEAFLKCLGEACEKTGWMVHAWCLMDNHYHLAIETPVPNLVEGMTWLQGTFAMRFNRYRKENGHIFQGRYKALVVEPGEGLGSLCHYIHLNPVRAGLCQADELSQWPWSSMYWLNEPRKRAGWYLPTAALEHAGGLADDRAGRRKYLEYLQWLAEDEPAQKKLEFDRMSKGWAIGSKGFKKELFVEHKEAAAKLELGDRDVKEILETVRQEKLTELLGRLGKTEDDIDSDRKSAHWKLAIAGAMKLTTTATNRWLAEKLRMGSVSEASRRISGWMRRPDPELLQKLQITTNHMT